MTVVRVGGGELLVHSPAQLSDQLYDQLAALGAVRFVVPASKSHGHLFMEQYRAAYPRAELLRGPRLAKKRSDISFHAELGERTDLGWADVLDQAVFRGHRLLGEIVFLHTPTRSLIVGDVCFNIEAGTPLSTRLWAGAAAETARRTDAPPSRGGA